MTQNNRIPSTHLFIPVRVDVYSKPLKQSNKKNSNNQVPDIPVNIYEIARGIGNVWHPIPTIRAKYALRSNKNNIKFIKTAITFRVLETVPPQKYDMRTNIKNFSGEIQPAVFIEILRMILS